MKKLYLFILAFLIGWFTLKAQNSQIDHWEYLIGVFDSNLKYVVADENTSLNWNAVDFNDDDWLTSGINGVGYGELWSQIQVFPNLGIEETTTIYTRTKFNVIDVAAIEQLQLSMYFSDAYVAYINGVEVSRQNIGEPNSKVTFNQFADSTQQNQANLYGYFKPGPIINKSVLSQCLVSGENVLAIEIHNDEFERSNHEYFSWLLAGLNTSEIHYVAADGFLPIKTELVESNLPIVQINVNNNGYPIPDEPKVHADLKVVFNTDGSFNAVSTTTFNYNGDIGIEIRGSSSMMNYSKKSFTIETRDSLGENLNVELVGMPQENDWVLYGPYGDKTMLRNVLTYELSNAIGKYAPRTQFVELVLNDDLLGIYVLMEKIKRDRNRVDVSRLRADEIAGDSLTGGYIIKIDKREGFYDGWFSEFGSVEHQNPKTYYQYVYPKWDEIQEEQKVYIQDFMNEFEQSLRADNFDHPTEGYRKFINTESFIDYMIINEFTKNMDGYRLSTFLYKDRDDENGKLHMGPVWDYNLALGNYQGNEFQGDNPEGWAIDFGRIRNGDQYWVPFWWDRLLQDDVFVEQLANRWHELRKTKLNLDSIYSSIDRMVEYTHEARLRNDAVWAGIYEVPVWPNMPFADSYEGEVDYLKSWISDRLAWVDDSIGYKRTRTMYVSIPNDNFKEYIGVHAYPNPFIDNVFIQVELETDRNLSIEIYNSLGQKINKLVEGHVAKGVNSFSWNGHHKNGALVPSGVYYYTVIVDGEKQYSGKLVKN